MTRAKIQKPVQNLKKILEHTTFCTFCLDTNKDLWHIDDTLHKGDWEGEALPLREILNGIFGNATDYLLLSDCICEPCKCSAISSYAFITTSKRTVEIYTGYLTQLDKEITDLVLHGKSKWENAMIVLKDIEGILTEPDEVKLKKVNMNPPSYICNSRGKGYHQKRSLVKHLNQHKLGAAYRSVNCPHCQRRPCVHERHLLPYDGTRIWKLEKITCVECNKDVGNTIPHLVSHVNREHLDIKASTCEECGESFYLECQHKKHSEYQHSTKFACESCFRKFRNQYQLSEHVKTCIDTVNTFKPSKCTVLSEMELGNQLHEDTHIPRRPVKTCTDPQQKIKRRGNIYNCLTCNKVLKTKQDLRVHVRKMHEKKPNLCLYCNKQYSCRREFLDHVQTQEHRKNVPYNIFNYHCDRCDYAAKTPIMLIAHVNRIHLNIRPFECQYCHKCYFDNAKLKHHMKTHTGDARVKVCDICGAHLAGPTALKKHRRLHTGERPYSCPYCDDRMNCASMLQTHIMRKHMEATIQCPLCDQKFHTMTNARGHVRKTHWKSKEKFDYTKLKGLSPKDYDFFRDRRKAVM